MFEGKPRSWFENKKSWLAAVGLAGTLGGTAVDKNMDVQKGVAEQKNVKNISESKLDSIEPIMVVEGVDKIRQEKKEIVDGLFNQAKDFLRHYGLDIVEKEYDEYGLTCVVFTAREVPVRVRGIMEKEWELEKFITQVRIDGDNGTFGVGDKKVSTVDELQKLILE